MLMSGICRIGNDPQLRYTSKNDPVLELSVAFNYGRKGADGKRPTQWIKATIWGKRAESLAQFLTKGTNIWLAMTDPHIETYQTKAQTEGHSLCATVTDVELIPRSQERKESSAAEDDDLGF